MTRIFWNRSEPRKRRGSKERRLHGSLAVACVGRIGTAGVVDWVADFDLAALEDAAAEAAAVLEGGFDACEGSFFQVAAGLAEFQAFQDDFADAECFADEVVEGHAGSEEV